MLWPLPPLRRCALTACSLAGVITPLSWGKRYATVPQDPDEDPSGGAGSIGSGLGDDGGGAGIALADRDAGAGGGGSGPAAAGSSSPRSSSDASAATGSSGASLDESRARNLLFGSAATVAAAGPDSKTSAAAV